MWHRQSGICWTNIIDESWSVFCVALEVLKYFLSKVPSLGSFLVVQWLRLCLHCRYSILWSGTKILKVRYCKPRIFKCIISSNPGSSRASSHLVKSGSLSTSSPSTSVSTPTPQATTFSGLPLNNRPWETAARKVLGLKVLSKVKCFGTHVVVVV